MDIKAVWASLPRAAGQHGWQVIALHPQTTVPVLAGVHLPEGTEGLLIDVPADAIPSGIEYPEARGFEVRPERLGKTRLAPVRISLMRTDVGNLDMFAVLAEDVALRVASQTSPGTAVSAFLSRIRSWQAFMRHHDGSRLSEEEETGLAGELLLLETWLMPQVDEAAALLCWMGPLGGLHDFVRSGAAIEVKATVGTRDSVKITSLDQMDEHTIGSLTLAVVRLLLGQQGRTLPEIVDAVRARVRSTSPDREPSLDERLLSVGYVDAHRSLYLRKFLPDSIHFYDISGEFPRLTRRTVPLGVSEAVYEVDLRRGDPWRMSPDVVLRRFMGENGGTG